jgi:eukaryotic-like serine/threonine-protein kinase
MIPPRERWVRLEPILDRALELDPAGWPSLLERGCRGDPTLREEAEALLDRVARIPGFLAGLPTPRRAPRTRSTVGPYRILRVLGSGGTSQVFLGQRPDGRSEEKVAIKVLHPFLPDIDLLTRFEAERRILASLDHPAITRILDAGETRDGRPYLVTEYFRGRPIHRHASRRRLCLRERLELVLRVCEAVGHAHQRGLVHRDLKPSNILVDDQDRVKLLDFGIAKVLHRLPGDPTLPRTRTGRRWMTPAYAAPEQVTGNPVTPATDVYQLGALLYELITGTPPFQLGGRDGHALERAVLEEDPPAPSRARGPGGARGVDPFGRTGLDAVVLKALRKDPADRYPSVAALAADLENCLCFRPVRARSRSYRLRRFLRRRRSEVAGAGAILLLAGSAGAILWQVGEAERAREAARTEALRASEANAQSVEITGLLIGLFRSADPWQGEIQSPEAARELIRIAGSHLATLRGDPGGQAKLYEALAQVHLSLDEYARAREVAARAVSLRRQEDPGDPAALALSLAVLGRTAQRQGELILAQEVLEEALDLQMRHLGDEHPDVARTLHLLASRRPVEDLATSAALHGRALEIRTTALGSHHPLTVESLRTLGRVERLRGRRHQAEAHLVRAVEILRESLGSEHPELAPAMFDLADLVRAYGDEDGRAEGLYRSAMAILQAAHGDDFPGLTRGLENLALIHSGRGEHLEAERLLREGLELRRRVFGPGHAALPEGTGFLAMELQRQGRLEEAEALRRDELALWRQARGPNDWNVAGAMIHLADIRIERGFLEEGEALYHEAMDHRIRARGERNGAVAALHGSLGRVYLLMGQPERAHSHYRRALDILREQRTDEHPEVLRIRAEMAAVVVPEAWLEEEA